MSVTLKELRISKGLNQAQCAKYLGMSTRNYQNYENDASKANTARYHAIYQKLEIYGQPVVTAAVPSQIPEFYTNVVTGTGLQALANSGLIGKGNTLLDYGTGKGRVCFYLSYQTRCHSIGVEYDERIFSGAEENRLHAVSGNRTAFEMKAAETYPDRKSVV